MAFPHCSKFSLPVPVPFFCSFVSEPFLAYPYVFWSGHCSCLPLPFPNFSPPLFGYRTDGPLTLRLRTVSGYLPVCCSLCVFFLFLPFSWNLTVSPGSPHFPPHTSPGMSWNLFFDFFIINFAPEASFVLRVHFFFFCLTKQFPNSLEIILSLRFFS